MLPVVEVLDEAGAALRAVAVTVLPFAGELVVPELLATPGVAPWVALAVAPGPERGPAAPAAGRYGSLTSMYCAPAEPGSARTCDAAVHLAAACEESPK